MDALELIKLIPVISAALVVLEKLYGYGRSILKKTFRGRSNYGSPAISKNHSFYRLRRHTASHLKKSLTATRCFAPTY
jgi:hypothetical protein